MLKSLFPIVSWDDIEFVGFDLDGTLYDEFDFIAQVYCPIAKLIAKRTGNNESLIYDGLVKRWLEKGSSYNRIFLEFLEGCTTDTYNAELIIEECLKLFRSFQPELSLSVRNRNLLNTFAARYKLFLVTDGSCDLQKAKLGALGLDRWFQNENIYISGCSVENIAKPSTVLLSRIELLVGQHWNPSTAVYFGDRDVDRQFAKASGFQYVPVSNMFYSKT